jgi:hypothetical protein
MKTILLFVIFITTNISYAQSKNDQIESLTNRLDSLDIVLNLERVSARAKIESKDSIIKTLNSQIEKINDVKNSLDVELSTAIQEISLKQGQIKWLENLIVIKSDSLELLLKKIEDSNIEFELSYDLLNKPALSSMEVIEDWLSQFNEMSSNSLSYIDKEMAALYYGEDEIMEGYGKVFMNYSIYKEGIVFNSKTIIDGAIYQLYIPLLKLSDVQRNIERLCKNMGGCIPPEDMEITYEETPFGIKITWGGGC